MPSASEIIKKARKESGNTQQDMADKLGLTLRNYQRIEDGAFPKYKTETIEQIDQILGISVYDIIYDKKVSTRNGATNHIDTKNPAEAGLKDKIMMLQDKIIQMQEAEKGQLQKDLGDLKEKLKGLEGLMLQVQKSVNDLVPVPIGQVDPDQVTGAGLRLHKSGSSAGVVRRK